MTYTLTCLALILVALAVGRSARRKPTGRGQEIALREFQARVRASRAGGR